MNTTLTITLKALFGICGAILAYLKPTFPFITICTIAVLFDCYTAWSLSRRVKKKFPDKAEGKLKSDKIGKIFVNLLKIYALIIFAWLIQEHITVHLDIHVTNIIAGAVCFWQIWSMLENESSCNDSSWAKIAQKVLIDKTSRHFDIDLSELKNSKNTSKIQKPKKNETKSMATRVPK